MRQQRNFSRSIVLFSTTESKSFCYTVNQTGKRRIAHLPQLICRIHNYNNVPLYTKSARQTQKRKATEIRRSKKRRRISTPAVKNSALQALGECSSLLASRKQRFRL